MGFLASNSTAVADFEENGYVILEGLFSEDESAPLSDEVDRVLNGEVEYVPERDLVWEPGSEPRRVRNAFRLHLYNPFFLRGAQHPDLLPVIGQILGSPLRLYGSQVFAKPATVGTAVPAHQDMPYWPFAPYELLTAWIALDDSSIENGCVRMVAGSHKLGILPHAPSNVPGNSLGLIPNAAVDALLEHPIEVRRGSCVLHHCLTVHRSEPNHSKHPRRGLIYNYMSPRVELVDESRLKGPAVFPILE